jgi:proline dehydrogenase
LKSIFTHLGENVTSAAEAEQVRDHYLSVLDQIRRARLDAEISVKLTHLGLDLGDELCYMNLIPLLARAGATSVVWLDMESSVYTDRTLEVYCRAREQHRNIGICVQAYLYRTKDDVERLIAAGAAVRLVKGAYAEPASMAFPHKRDVDENFFDLARRLLGREARINGVRAAIATHDRVLIRRITNIAERIGIPRSELEFQMLYGIQAEEQLRLAREGYDSRVFIGHGTHWYPWFMRRLAERPANVWFIVRNFF